MHKADNLPQSCAVVMKSGRLNFLEPSGPVQAFNGTALPLPIHFFEMSKIRPATYCNIPEDENIQHYVEMSTLTWHNIPENHYLKIPVPFYFSGCNEFICCCWKCSV